MDDQYKISIYYTRMTIPFSIFSHFWIEITKNDSSSRYDVWGTKKDPTDKKEVYVKENIFLDNKGVALWFWIKPFETKGRQRGKLFRQIKGGKDSSAEGLYNKIISEVHNYPGKNDYKMIKGPNSNSFVQWLLDLDNEEEINLPYHAWGKDYWRKFDK